MKIKQGFIKRKVADKWLVVTVGELSQKYNNMIELNETASMIWDGLVKGLSVDEIVESIVKEYDVSADTAKSGVDKLIEKMAQEGIFE